MILRISRKFIEHATLGGNFTRFLTDLGLEEVAVWRKVGGQGGWLREGGWREEGCEIADVRERE